MSDLFNPKDRNGVIARRNIIKKTLAEVIRARMEPEDFFYWLRSIAAGKDPDAKENGFNTPIDMRIRLTAMQMLLNRAYGGVPKHFIVEAEVTPLRPALEKLSQEKLQEIRSTMRGLLEAGKEEK